MHKAFDFHIRVLPDLPDLIKRQFSRRNHPFYSCLLQKRSARVACNGHLRAGMNFKSGKALPYILQHSRILDDHSIQSPFVERPQIAVQFFCLPVLEKRVDRKIQTFPEKMGFLYRLDQFIPGEIIRIGSGSESGPSGINSVRSCGYGSPKAVV